MSFKKRIAAVIAPVLLICMILTSLVFPASADNTAANKQQVYDALSSTGQFGNAAICGIMANMEKESTFNPTATSSGGSYGLCQWTGSRKSDLINYCSRNGLSSSSVSGQVAFLVYELQNTYTSVYSTLQNTANSADGAYNAGYRFCYDFERPSNVASKSSQRGSIAKSSYWPAYCNATSTTTTTTTTTTTVTTTTPAVQNKTYGCDDVTIAAMNGEWVSVAVEDTTKKVNYTGVCKNEYGWWRVENGKVDFTANGIYKNDYGWWKTTDGKVTFSENGVFENENGWWYVKNSKVDFSYNGLAENQYGTWYVENGKVDLSYTGNLVFEGQLYSIEKGKVVNS